MFAKQISLKFLIQIFNIQKTLINCLGHGAVSGSIFPKLTLIATDDLQNKNQRNIHCLEFSNNKCFVKRTNLF